MTVALDDFAKYVRPHVPGCPETLLTDAILRTCIDFCTSTELLSESVDITLVAETETYAVAPVTASMYVARVRSAVFDELPLEKTTRETWFLGERRFETGDPEKYFCSTRAEITFEPVPDATGTVELDVVICPARTATVVPGILFDEWASIIAAGAKADLLLMIGMPWGNASLGAHYAGVYAAGVATTAVQVSGGNVGAAMRIAPSPI